MIGLLYRAADAHSAPPLADNHGRMGEDLAHRFLRARGCTVVARNYRPLSGSGEIDLVVWDGGKLVFVEVKTRSSAEFGPPESRGRRGKARARAACRPRLRPPRRNRVARYTLRYRQHCAGTAAAHRMAARRVLIHSSFPPPIG